MRRFGHFEIEALIGKGGMGEVFRARDTRLGRTVAIKMIPTHLSHRGELRQRFEIEARAIAGLSHPRICALFDIGVHDGSAFMVMEYLEGESLASRLLKGPIPLKEALSYGVQIADALDAAHRGGVVHRDIKPGNIMLTKAGVKLLDFGLARLRDRGHEDNADNPTLSVTGIGSVMGTPQYMAPEQIEGREADARSDVFAFGSVMYEMLSGRKAFPGKDVGEVMNAVLRCDPPPEQADLSPVLNRVLGTCWVRDADERWQSMGDLRRELQWIASESSVVSTAGPLHMGRREMLAWGVAGVAGVAASVALVRNLRVPAIAPKPVHFTITDAPPEFNMNFFQFAPAISPDGSMVAFAAGRSGDLKIWLRELDSDQLREVPASDGALSAFWSPDSRFLAFYAQGQLKRVPAAGGPAESICESDDGTGGTWNSDNVIVFQNGTSGPLFQVSAAGGTPTPVTTLAAGQQGHWRPTFLPDGKTILFTTQGGAGDQQGIFAVKLGSTQTRRVSPLISSVRYAPSGHLLFYQNDQLVAQRFDPATMTLEGEIIPAARRLWGFQGVAAFDISKAGTLIYSDAELVRSQLIWVDRNGRPIAKLGDPGPYIHIDLSKDEKRLLLERYESVSGTLWVMDTARGIAAPFTSGPNWSLSGQWSPDGTQVAYTATVESAIALFLKAANGTGKERRITTAPMGPSTFGGWSPDGKYAVATLVDPSSNSSILQLYDASAPGTDEIKPIVYSADRGLLGQGRVSPDGRWIAYVSAETMSPEIYVSAFPKQAGKWRVSSAGGVQPRWSADSRELYYLAADKTLMAVPIPSTPEQAGSAVPLFRTDVIGFFGLARSDYAPAADGKRFLLNNRVGNTLPQTIHVITDWVPERGNRG